MLYNLSSFYFVFSPKHLFLHTATATATTTTTFLSTFSLIPWSSKNSWQPIMTSDTTALSYWLNWRCLICAIWVIMSLALASFLISRKKSTGLLYDDEVWRPCLKGIHPAWLLAFRVVAFLVLLIILILNVVVDGVGIFYYYTQWTFTLITIYFGLGSVLSMYGCYQHHKKVDGNRVDTEELDAKQGTYGASAQAENSNASNVAICLRPNEEHHVHQIAGFWGYVFQIIFQMNAGAVILTDCVFWFLIVPFLEIKDYNLNFLIINMHTTNVVFLLGDTAFNCLRFPLFRIAYFFRHFPVDPPCLCLTLVLIGGIVAYTMLWHFCLGNEDETLSVRKMVS